MKHAHVSFLPCANAARDHEVATHRAAAERLASLMGLRFLPDVPSSQAVRAYVVPSDTLTSISEARALGIESENDLFGGVVPWPYMATKTISHPLVGPHAAEPDGWCAAFATRVSDVVLPGFSAFSVADARRAAQRLPGDGAVRLKLACGVGGSGQQVVRNQAELDAALDAFGADAVRQGLVIECDLAAARTFSVGRVRVGDLEATYFGEQRTTRNQAGAEVYGGSTLTVLRGGFERLSEAADDGEVRQAIAFAGAYHAAALACFEGMFASRCNYDVVLGRDALGRPRMGVLEQSWRIGGATGAEIAALQAFADDPSLAMVRASTVEQHSVTQPLPERAIMYFRGVDPHVGPLTKYALLHDDAHSRRTA